MLGLLGVFQPEADPPMAEVDSVSVACSMLRDPLKGSLWGMFHVVSL